MRTEPDNCTPRPRPRPLPARASIAPSSPASRPFVLAALRALRLDPGCGCRTPQPRRKRPENGHNNHNPALPNFAASGMTPRDWQRSRVRFSAQVNDGCGVRHRPARGVRLLYFSAVHVKTITSNRIDHFVSLLRDGPRTRIPREWLQSYFLQVVLLHHAIAKPWIAWHVHGRGAKDNLCRFTLACELRAVRRSPTCCGAVALARVQRGRSRRPVLAAGDRHGIGRTGDRRSTGRRV
jgi:hypothetical protein